jgi:hypothetical protein
MRYARPAMPATTISTADTIAAIRNFLRMMLYKAI